MPRTFAAIDFSNGHMRSNARSILEHTDAELVAVCDENPESPADWPPSMPAVADELGIPERERYTDVERCLAETDPDVVFLGPTNADHAALTERVAVHDVHVIVEKPFADSLADADRMIEAVGENLLAINWPLAWTALAHTVKAVLEEGTIGDILEIHYYDGNTGTGSPGTWYWDSAEGGGSMLDFLGYGVVFAIWFRDGVLPESVTAEAYVPVEHDVDVGSQVIARHDTGLSTFGTTWRAFTSRGDHEPQPRTGFDVVGTEGTLSTKPHEGGWGNADGTIRVQTEDRPGGFDVDLRPLEAPNRGVIEYLIDRLERDVPIDGPSAPGLNRQAQRIVDAARESAERGERVRLS